ncbi:hypothetical protein Tco_1214149 [Tanacetum coccineum]
MGFLRYPFATNELCSSRVSIFIQLNFDNPFERSSIQHECSKALRVSLWFHMRLEEDGSELVSGSSIGVKTLPVNLSRNSVQFRILCLVEVGSGMFTSSERLVLTVKAVSSSFVGLAQKSFVGWRFGRLLGGCIANKYLPFICFRLGFPNSSYPLVGCWRDPKYSMYCSSGYKLQPIGTVELSLQDEH